MALPKINTLPEYKLTVPSTGKVVNFRPFLVKEQKVLLIALESQDQQQMLQAVVNTIKACVTDNIDVNSLATFDVEYMFTVIRSKSAGETSKVLLKCQNEDCGAENEYVIDFESLEVDCQREMEVKLSDQYTLVMRFPQWRHMTDISIGDEQETLTEAIYKLSIACLSKLNTEEDSINLDDETEEEKSAFLENLTSDQFSNVMEFVNNLPQLKHHVNFKCSECGHDNEMTLSGMNDFF